MDDFRSTAFDLTFWYAVLTTIVSVLLIAKAKPSPGSTLVSTYRDERLLPMN